MVSTPLDPPGDEGGAEGCGNAVVGIGDGCFQNISYDDYDKRIGRTG